MDLPVGVQGREAARYRERQVSGRGQCYRKLSHESSLTGGSRPNPVIRRKSLNGRKVLKSVVQRTLRMLGSIIYLTIRDNQTVATGELLLEREPCTLPSNGTSLFFATRLTY
jgi:hypothetical protein